MTSRPHAGRASTPESQLLIPRVPPPPGDGRDHQGHGTDACLAQLQSQGLQAYEALAPIYEHHWGEAFLGDAINLFNQLLASHLKENAHVLDLCCGAGHFSAWLRTQWPRVTGVDASQSMIALARQRVPHAEFHAADMRSFCVPSVFDAAVCFYNSVNQILTSDALQATFTSVRGHLRPGGRFLFDIVLEEGYARSWDADEVVTLGAQTCQLTYRYDQQNRLARCRATMHSPARDSAPETWEFCQRPHSLPMVMEHLRQSGFQFVQQHAVAGTTPPGSRVALVALLSESPSHSAAQM